MIQLCSRNGLRSPELSSATRDQKRSYKAVVQPLLVVRETKIVTTRRFPKSVLQIRLGFAIARTRPTCRGVCKSRKLVSDGFFQASGPETMDLSPQLHELQYHQPYNPLACGWRHVGLFLSTDTPVSWIQFG